MAENPPLNRIYVLGYSANDRDYPIVSLNADPRVAGYKVPEDLSTCPDKRYPNHVFTGAQPLSGDERVRHVWEILPSPWVPFTRYDDDLGPVQGRRRSVKNEGQVAILAADKRTTYEAREGSAIVYTELEETWSIDTDEDGNSLFPIRDRDFYDPSRGPVQERRQLFVPTGEEEGSLENVNGVITQTSYEPYNEFLSVKIVQTYKVDGPQLIGKATDNDGQLVTVTTQRKGADGYIPPNPTATRTVEVSREDAESLVERIVDTPEVFKANTFSIERPDPIPQKFRVAVPIQSSQEIVEGTAVTPTLSEGEISKSEEQRNKFIKRISSTSRDQAVLPKTLTQKTTTNEGILANITETLKSGDATEQPNATRTVESEALGDGNYVVRITEVPKVFAGKMFSVEKPDIVPQKFRTLVESITEQETIEGKAEQPSLSSGDIAKSEQQVTEFIKRVSITSRDEAQLPVTLVQKATNQEKQFVTITETLQQGNNTEQPTAKVDIQSEAIGDGKYIVTKTEAPEVFKAQVFRSEKADLTPQKFRAKQTDKTKEETVEGQAVEPSLGENEFSKTEQQINKFVKRVTTTKRETDTTETLNEEVITPEGQLATRTITLAKTSQTITPSATVIDGDIEELGDGRTIKTEIEVPNVFDSKQESLEKPEIIPPEFRATLQNKTISLIKAGQSIDVSSLDINELSKTQQRITEHKIRETTVTRPEQDYQPLTGQIIDNDLINVTRVRTVVKGEQTIQPSATVSGTVEALGDGYTLKTEDTKAFVFDNKFFSSQKPDTIPEKFRANIEIKKTEEVVEQTEAGEQSLEENEYLKTERRLTEFTVEKVKVERASDYESIQSSDLEETWGISIPYTESIVDEFGNEENCEYDGLGDNKYIKRIYDINQLSQKLDSFSAKTPTTINLNLPKILKEVNCVVEKSESVSEDRNSIPSAFGEFGNLSFEDAGSFTSTVSFIPRFDVVLEEIWANDIEATLHVFFLKSEELTVEAISGKCSADGFWPSLNPSSFSTVVFGKSESKTLTVSVNRFYGVDPDGFIQRNNNKTRFDNSVIPVNLSIPNCIVEEDIQINESETYDYNNTIVIQFPSISTPSFTTPSTPTSIPFSHNIDFNTTVTIKKNGEIPKNGKYVINSSAEPYKFGYFIVRAITLDAAKINRN